MKLLVISDLHAHNDVLDKMDNIFAQDVTSESLLPSSFGENDSLVDMVQ